MAGHTVAISALGSRERLSRVKIPMPYSSFPFVASLLEALKLTSLPIAGMWISGLLPPSEVRPLSSHTLA